MALGLQDLKKQLKWRLFLKRAFVDVRGRRPKLRSSYIAVACEDGQPPTCREPIPDLRRYGGFFVMLETR